MGGRADRRRCAGHGPRMRGPHIGAIRSDPRLMTVDEIKEILELMREHELAEFELQRGGETLRLRRQARAQWTGPMPAGPAAAVHAPAAAPAAAPPQIPGESAVLEPASEDVDLAIVKSPIVGTFYRSS